MRVLKISLTSSALALLVLSSASMMPQRAHAAETYSAVSLTAPGLGSRDNTEVHLFVQKSRRRLLAVTSNPSGVQVWEAVNKLADEWVEREDLPFTQDSTNVDVLTLVGFHSHVYTVINSTDGFEVWRWSRSNAWEQVLEQHGQNTTATAMNVLADGRLYLATRAGAPDGKAMIYRSRTGRDWQEFGSEGLGLNVSSITDFASFHGGFLAVTEDGMILSKERMSQWEVVYEQDQPLQALQVFGGFVLAGGSGPHGVQVLRSIDGRSWSSVVTDGFGNANNSVVTRFSGPDAPHGMIRVFVRNDVDGFQIWETERDGDLISWQLFRDANDVGADQHSVVSVRRYHGQILESTAGNNGGIVMRIKKEDSSDESSS